MPASRSSIRRQYVSNDGARPGLVMPFIFLSEFCDGLDLAAKTPKAQTQLRTQIPAPHRENRQEITF